MMNRIIKNSFFQQILFWSLSFLILYRLFTREGDNGLTDVYFTILFHFPLLLAVYGNYYLVQQFIIKKSKIGFYLVGLLLIIVLGIGFHFFTYDYLADWLFQGYYFVTFYTIWEVLEFVAGYAILSLLLILSKNWFLLKERQLALEKENHLVKLASLKAQINPHFLFNSLNNIYGITNKENKLGRSYLLKLSDALRYMIYDTSTAFVPLEKELDYLKNYVDLEKLRMDNPEAIQLQLHGDFSSYLIAPLILLPLVENCFKHCDRMNPEIRIEISLKKEELILETYNNKGDDENVEAGNIGLENLKKRLKLIYPNKHHFSIHQTPTIYQNKLELTVN